MSALLLTGDEILAATSAIGGIIVGWALHELSNRWSARRLFDHRVRLEKEYSLYVDLWEKLFELRRNLGAVFETVSTAGGLPPSDDSITECFNACQAIVRKGEPFMSSLVFVPAREIVTLAREIINNLGKIRALNRRDEAVRIRPDTDAEEKRAETKIQLEDENDVSFQRLEELYEHVSRAVRARVTPP